MSVGWKKHTCSLKYFEQRSFQSKLSSMLEGTHTHSMHILDLLFSNLALIEMIVAIHSYQFIFFSCSQTYTVYFEQSKTGDLELLSQLAHCFGLFHAKGYHCRGLHKDMLRWVREASLFTHIHMGLCRKAHSVLCLLCSIYEWFSARLL